MTEATEKTSIPYEKSRTAGFRKLIFVIAAFFGCWLVFGQLLPRLMLDYGPTTVKQELNMNPSAPLPPAASISINNAPVELAQGKRPSFREQLEAKDKEITTLRDEIAQLDTRLKAVEEKAAAAPPVNNTSSADTQAAATSAAQAVLTQAQSAYTEKLESYNQKLAASNEKITTLQNQLTALQSKSNEAEQQRARMASIETAVHQQHELIEAVKTEIAGAQIQTVRQLSALASFVPLKEAIQRGEAFDIPLSQLLNFTHGNRKVEELAGQLTPIAKQGTPSISVLRSEFQSLLLKALATDGESNSLRSNLHSLISIRKTGEQPGSTDEAIFARAESRLSQNDMDAVLKELAELSPSATKVMEPWIEKAKRYILIDRLINNMQLALTKEIPAVQTSMPDQESRDVAPEKPAPAAVENNSPATSPAQDTAKPVALQPAKTDAVKTEAEKKPAAKTAPEKHVEKPATKAPAHKEAKKPAAKVTDAPKEDSEEPKQESLPAPAAQKPSAATNTQQNSSYPGN